MLTLPELKKADPKMLAQELENARKALYGAQFEIRTAATKTSHVIRQWKKYIARILTLTHHA